MNLPYLENDAIWRAADDFRTARLAGHDTPPIDVLFVVDVILRFDVIEIPDLFADLRMDAAIVPCENILYIDRDAIEGWDRRDRWIERRLRFSIAHELGHLMLHRDCSADIRFSSVEQFKAWIKKHRKSSRIEDQADEFAGRLLGPPDILRMEYDRFQQKLSAADSAWHEVEGMRSHVAKNIAPRFGVNPQVIETRFVREGIWPME